MIIRNCKRIKKVLESSCCTYRPKLCSEKKKKRHKIEKNWNTWTTSAGHNAWLPRGTCYTNLFSWLKREQMCWGLFQESSCKFFTSPHSRKRKGFTRQVKKTLVSSWSCHEGGLPGQPRCRQPCTRQLWPAHRADVVHYQSPPPQAGFAVCALYMLHSPGTLGPLRLQVAAKPEEEEKLFQLRSLAGG